LGQAVAKNDFNSSLHKENKTGEEGFRRKKPNKKGGLKAFKPFSKN